MRGSSNWFRLWALVGAGLAASSALGGELFRTMKPAAMFEEAVRDKKLVLIDFYASWCAPCKQMDATTWADPQVRAWVERNTVPVKFDGDAEKALKEAWRVEGYPTIILAAADGSELRRWEGFHEAGAFLKQAEAALKGAPERSGRPGDQAKRDDPFAREREADRAIAEKDYGYAARELLWCFDHGPEKNSDYRLGPHSRLPGKILELEQFVPSVRAELTQRRDALGGRLAESFDPAVNLNFALDFASLSIALSQPQAIVKALDGLPKDPKSQTAQKVLVFFVLDELIAARRFDDLLQAVGNPFVALDAKASLIGMQEKSPRAEDQAAAAIERSRSVAELARVYQAMLAVGRSKAGARFGERILRFHPTADTYAALIERSARAGKKDVAEGWVTRALSDLPGDQQRRLVPIMGQIEGWLADAPASQPGEGSRPAQAGSDAVNGVESDEAPESGEAPRP